MPVIHSILGRGPGTMSSLGRSAVIIIISLVFVSILTSVLFYAIGFFNGCFCHRHRCDWIPSNGMPNQPAPLYDNVHDLQKDTRQKNIELRENVAYGQV